MGMDYEDHVIKIEFKVDTRYITLKIIVVGQREGRMEYSDKSRTATCSESQCPLDGNTPRQDLKPP
jgi:hypothetical protein